MTDDTDARTALAEIVAGLDGVTPGQWGYSTSDNGCWVFGLKPDAVEFGIVGRRMSHSDASHIARCDPDTMRGLAALVASQDAEIARLREALEPFAEYMHTDEGRIDLDNKDKELPDDLGVGWIYLTHGDFRRARAALSPSPAQEAT